MTLAETPADAESLVATSTAQSMRHPVKLRNTLNWNDGVRIAARAGHVANHTDYQIVVPLSEETAILI